MNVGLAFKVAIGGVLAVVAGAVAWNVASGHDMKLSVHNGLGEANCTFALDGERWDVSLKPNETVERIMIFGVPRKVTWTCKTNDGVVTGQENGCGGKVTWVGLREPAEQEAFCLYS